LGLSVRYHEINSRSKVSAASNVLHGNFYTLSGIVYPWSSPIPLVFVEGNGSEMGTQFTKATKNLTKKNILFNLPIVERILRRSRIKNSDYVAEIEEGIRKYTTSEFLDEIQSIANITELPYESVVLVNANVDITSMSAGLPEDSFSCSTFAAWGKATRNHIAIAGHNDDGNRVMDQYAVLKIARPKHGHAFMCPQVPGYLAYDCMVNANQVFVCGTAVDNKMKKSEAIREGPPNWALYRWLGQFSSSASDAAQRLISVKSMTLKNWCFVSREGGKVVEATPKHYSFMKFPSISGDWYGISTCVVCASIKRHVVQSKEPTSGVHRMASIAREVKNRYGTITPESAIDIMSSHYDSLRKRRMPSEHTPCRHMEFEGKLAGTCRCITASFDGGTDGQETRTRIDVSLGNPCNGYWRRLYFDESFNLKAGYDKDDKFELELSKIPIII